MRSRDLRTPPTGDKFKKVRSNPDTPRDPTPPKARVQPPPPPPPGGPPTPQPGGQARITSWKGVAAALGKDLGADGAMKACAWPCFKTFLLGGPPCTDNCGKCAKGAGRGDDAARARARNKLADLERSGAIDSALWPSIKAAERSRA